MTHFQPRCDRHTNLQMVPCLLRKRTGMVAGHACPVPGCDRYLVGETYLSSTDAELVLKTKRPGLGKINPKSISKKSFVEDNVDRPLNRHAAARAAILRAIEEKQRS